MQALVFWLFALLAVAGAVATITRKNAVTAVMTMVGTLASLAGLYVLLFAHFLAVIQVLVYAGAIMVLFVFVVMILNKEEDEPWALRGIVGKGLAALGLGYLLYRTVDVLLEVPLRVPEAQGELGDFGTTRAMGRVLFSDYLFPFEAVSLVLLIAVVGVLVVSHPSHLPGGDPAASAAQAREEAKEA